MGHMMPYACFIKTGDISQGGKKMSVIILAAALMLYIPMSMVFVLGGKK